jgi:hypothetical protein
MTIFRQNQFWNTIKGIASFNYKTLLPLTQKLAMKILDIALQIYFRY